MFKLIYLIYLILDMIIFGDDNDSWRTVMITSFLLIFIYKNQ
jgi:hypothetical protein